MILRALVFSFLVIASGCGVIWSEHSGEEEVRPIPVPYAHSEVPPGSSDSSRVEEASPFAAESEFQWSRVERDSAVSFPGLDSVFHDYLWEAQLSCLSACPSEVGVLLIFEPALGTIARCTSFLVGEDVLATNSHCLRPQGQMAVLFPNGRAIAISGVLYASDLSQKGRFHQDYALLQLSRPVQQTRSLKVSRKGLVDQSQVTIWHVSQHPSNSTSDHLGRKQFILSPTNCLVFQNLPIFPAFKADSSPIASLNNCQISQGDSGSPVIAEDGSIRAILSAYFNIANTPVGQLIEPGDLIKIPRIAMATQFSCIPDQSEATKKLSPFCQEDLSHQAYVAAFQETYRMTLAKVDQRLRNQVNEVSRKWVLENSTVFRWKIVPAAQSQATKDVFAAIYESPPVQAELDCIEPAEKWKHDFRSMRFFYQSEAVLSFPKMIWGITAGVDTSLRFFPKVNIAETGTVKVRFNPSHMIKVGISEIEVTTSVRVGEKEIAFPPTKKLVPFCS